MPFKGQKYNCLLHIVPPQTCLSVILDIDPPRPPPPFPHFIQTLPTAVDVRQASTIGHFQAGLGSITLPVQSQV
jgi:hypothetical protein